MTKLTRDFYGNVLPKNYYRITVVLKGEATNNCFAEYDDLVKYEKNLKEYDSYTVSYVERDAYGNTANVSDIRKEVMKYEN